MSGRLWLHALAERMGLLPEYTRVDGVRCPASDQTREALLHAMHVDASSEGNAQSAVEQFARHDDARLLPAFRVLRLRESVDRFGPTDQPNLYGGRTHSIELSFRPLPGLSGRATWTVELCEEGGPRHLLEGNVELGDDRREQSIALALELPLGCHSLEMNLSSAGGQASGSQDLIVVPATCPPVTQVLGPRRAFGLCANLYTLRSRRNWGVGDLTDLRELISWSAGYGAEFVGVNPLHACRNRGLLYCPYSPVSRLFGNSIYLDVEAIPEFSRCAEARALMASDGFRAEVAAAREGSSIRYEATHRLQERVLRLLYETFREHELTPGTSRGTDFQVYVRAQGPELDGFATFSALDERFAGDSRVESDWRRWPGDYRSVYSPGVAEFARNHAVEIDFYKFVQFEFDRQLAVAAESARRAGMSLGLYQDLAVGAAADGSDVWAHPQLFAVDAGIGAPPEPFAPDGQDWRLPPMIPAALESGGFRFWRRLVQQSLAHSGALRIDHAMGLLRQFWIPRGQPASAGAYVRYPSELLFGLVALESVRRGAVVIAEDLGTVPEGFAGLLADWGILSSQVMLFQRDHVGAFLPSSAYSDRALVTFTTHDHASLAGFWYDADLHLRRRVGLIDSDEQLRQLREGRNYDRLMLRQRLAAEGKLDEKDAESYPALTAGVHAFLADTAAPLIGLMLDDVAEEREPVNLPGVTAEQHPSWCRRMTMSVEQLQASSLARSAMLGAQARRK